MRIPLLVIGRLGALTLLLAWVLAGDAAAQEGDTPPRLLFVIEADSRLPFARTVLAGVEAELGPDFTSRSEIYVEYLDLLRFNDPRELALKRAFLAGRYGDLGLDAVMVLGTNALSFVLDHRDRIAPGAPIIFGAVGKEGLRTALAGRTVPDMTGVLSLFDFTGTLDLAMAVQPGAAEIVVVAGSATFDRQWRSTVTATLGATYRGLPVRMLPEGTANDYIAAVQDLDPATIVVLLSVNRDSAGRRFLPVQYSSLLASASRAPVWSVYETQVGAGIVGGSVEDLTATGRQIGSLVRLATEDAPLPAPRSAVAVPTVDWREMQRHRLDPGRLPDGSRILFRDPTLWQEYRDILLVIAAVVLAQTATIVALLVQRRRYLGAQALLDLEHRQLVHVSRNLRLGQLSASLAHEINQPLAAIQANATAGATLAARSPPDMGELAEIFQDINADVQRAGATIAGLRRLMVKGEVAMAPTDLNEAVRATLPLVQNELDANGARLRLSLAPGPLMVKGNAAQLQQIVLNLVLNASEAMSHQPAGSRRMTVATAAAPPGRATLTVEDAGPGVTPDRREDTFRPFVSTKPAGLGVGLAICRSIAEAHGGTLAFADVAGPGARVVLSLPEVAA